MGYDVLTRVKFEAEIKTLKQKIEILTRQNGELKQQLGQVPKRTCFAPQECVSEIAHDEWAPARDDSELSSSEMKGWRHESDIYDCTRV
jgi:hypothetical protein